MRTLTVLIRRTMAIFFRHPDDILNYGMARAVALQVQRERVRHVYPCLRAVGLGMARAIKRERLNESRTSL